MAGEAALQVRGLAEARKAAREVAGKAGEQRLKEAYGEVSAFMAARAQAEARAGSPLAEKMAGAIRPRTTARSAGLSIRATQASPAAFVAFWGTDRQRLGWFAQGRYDGYTSRDQKLPPWVGSSWKTAWERGNFGEGPYAIREAAASSVDDIERRFVAAMERALRDVGLI